MPRIPTPVRRARRARRTSRGLIGVLATLLLCGASGAEDDAILFTLDRTVHFAGPDGGDVVAPAGRYLVVAGDATLTLQPADAPESGDLVLAATTGTHDAEDLERAYAVAVAGEAELADVETLAVAFPGGVTLEAVGTTSGVATRGLFDDVKKAAKQTSKKVSSSASAAAKKAQQQAAKAKAEAEQRAKAAAAAAAAAKAAAEAEAKRKEKEAAIAAAQAKAEAERRAQAAALAMAGTVQTVGETVSGAAQVVGDAAQGAGEDLRDWAGNVLSDADRIRRQAMCKAQSKSLEAWSNGSAGGGASVLPIRKLILEQADKPAVRKAFIDLAHALAARFAPDIARYGQLAEVLNRPGNLERVEGVLSASSFCSRPVDALRAEIRSIIGRPLPDEIGTRGEGTGLGWSIQLQGALEGIGGVHGGHGVAFRSGTRGHWITWLGAHLATDIGAEVVVQAGFWPGLDPAELAGPYFGVGIGGSVGSPVGFAVGIDIFFDRDPFTTGGLEANPAVATGLRLKPEWVAEHFTGLTVTPFTGASAGVMPVEGQVEGGYTATLIGF